MLFWAVTTIIVTLITTLGLVFRDEIRTHLSNHQNSSEESTDITDLQKKLQSYERSLTLAVTARQASEAQAKEANAVKDLALENAAQLEARLKQTEEDRQSAQKQADYLSERQRSRLVRIQDNYLTGRHRSYPAPDGSGRFFNITWDGSHVDLVSKEERLELQTKGNLTPH